MPLEDVDPVCIDRTYFLVPGAAPAQRRPYELLLEAMEETGVGAIGRFVRAGRESLCLVRARGDALVLETLFLVEDVYSQAEIDEAMDATEVKERGARARATDRSRASAAEFDPSELASEYRRDLRALLEAKLRGEEIAEPEPVAEPAPVVDLIEALKASVAAAKASSSRPKKAEAKPKAARPARKAARK